MLFISFADDVFRQYIFGLASLKLFSRTFAARRQRDVTYALYGGRYFGTLEFRVLFCPTVDPFAAVLYLGTHGSIVVARVVE